MRGWHRTACDERGPGRTVVMVLAALLVTLSLVFLVGCGDDDAVEGTTTEATTEAPPTPAEEPGEAEGDVAAGQQFFASTCTGCHWDGGRDAGGVGPQLAGQGLTAEVVEQTVVDGTGIKPPGLATGDDLDDVVAYVVSLQ